LALSTWRLIGDTQIPRFVLFLQKSTSYAINNKRKINFVYLQTKGILGPTVDGLYEILPQGCQLLVALRDVIWTWHLHHDGMYEGMVIELLQIINCHEAPGSK
jgi:hypothetical protein